MKVFVVIESGTGAFEGVFLAREGAEHLVRVKTDAEAQLMGPDWLRDVKEPFWIKEVEVRP